MAAALVVDELGVFFVSVPVVGTGAVLQFGDHIGCPHVLLAPHTPGIFAARVEHVFEHRVVTERRVVHADGFFGNLENANALNTAGCAGEILGDRGGIQTNHLEQLRTAVAHVGAHAHFGHDLGEALAHGFHIVVDGLFSAQITRQFLVDTGQCFHRQVGVNGFCAVACQHAKLMHFARGAGLHHQACGGTQTFHHQMLVNR